MPINSTICLLSNIAVTGQFNLIKGGLATVVVSGSIGKNRVHAVFQKPLKAGKFSGALLLTLVPSDSLTLSEMTTQAGLLKSTIFGYKTLH